MRKNAKLLKMILGVVVCFLSLTLVLVGVAYAYKYYPNKEGKCLSDSNNRDKHSVQWACDIASSGGEDHRGQNVCASWLGGVGNPSTNVTVYAPSKTATVYVALWGMCTDKSDRASKMLIIDANNNKHGEQLGLKECLNGENEICFTRTGAWGSPNSQIMPLNVAVFIQGLTPSIENGNEVYTRRVIADRKHSDTASMAVDISTIKLIIGKEDPEPLDLCEGWKPSSYSNSNENDGATSIVVKAKNTAGRFNKTGSGAWHHDNPDGLDTPGPVGPIYAKPGDNIRWKSCYYPGVQKTAYTDVSDIDGVRVEDGVEGYEELDKTDCADDIQVDYKDLWDGYEFLGKGTGKWENKYTISGGLGGGGHFGDFGHGNYNLSKSEAERDGIHSTGSSRGGDVGEVLVQKGETGSPTKATISSKNPTEKIYKNDGPCCAPGDEEGADCCDVADLEKDYGKSWADVIPQHCKRLACTNKYSQALKSAAMTTTDATDTATVIVPYNYINDTSVTIADSPDPVLAGEVAPKVTKVEVTVGKKSNGLTVATYATVVPKVKVKLFMYVTDRESGAGGETTGDPSCDEISDVKQCIEIKSNSGDTPSKENVTGSASFTDFNGTRNAFDASAGDYLCFISAVWPASSGADDSINEDGDNQWKFGSSPSCRIIAKKPTFQVWGGSMYSVGNVIANPPEKRNAYAIDYKKSTIKTNFKLTGTNVQHRFTPWVEQSLVIADGITTSVDSGSASSGEEGRTVKFCDGGIWLTFANTGCTTTSGAGKSKIGSGLGEDKNDSGDDDDSRHELIDYWVDKAIRDEVKASGELNHGGGEEVKLNGTNDELAEKYHRLPAGTKASIWYVYARKNTAAGVSNGNLKISASNIHAGRTFLVEATGTVTITGNIIYDGLKDSSTNKYTKEYETLGDISKVIIYAKNVNIQCGVTEVDAIIITKSGGKVKTCSDGGSDVNSSMHAKQLKIFGMVIADSIDVKNGRTYGAAAAKATTNVPACQDSDSCGGVKAQNPNTVAAEIFDYDSTMLMWEEFMSGSGETDTYETTYTHELAPRY